MLAIAAAARLRAADGDEGSRSARRPPRRPRARRALRGCAPGSCRPGAALARPARRAAVSVAGRRRLAGGRDRRARRAAPTAAVAGAARHRPRRPHRPRAAVAACWPARRRWSSATPAPRTWPPRWARRSSRCSPPSCPAVRWRPYGVPHLLLGDQGAACRDSRARECPVPGHPCLAVGHARRRSWLPSRHLAGTAVDGGARVNVLIWHVHGSWTTAFVQGRHDYLLPTLPERGPDGRRASRAPGTGRPSAVELTPERAARRADVDVVVLQRPEELELAADWTGRRPGRDVPAVCLEHNAPQGRRADDAAPARRPRRPAASCTSPTSTRCSGTPAARRTA